MVLNAPFPDFKTTEDDKHDIEVFIENLTDYCTMQNWFDPSKETGTAKWTKPEKAMACLGLSTEDLAKSHSVINVLREYYGASIGVSGERQKFLRLLQNEDESIGSWETRIRNQASQCEYENFADEFMRDSVYRRLNPACKTNR